MRLRRGGGSGRSEAGCCCQEGIRKLSSSWVRFVFVHVSLSYERYQILGLKMARQTNKKLMFIIMINAIYHFFIGASWLVTLLPRHEPKKMFEYHSESLKQPISWITTHSDSPSNFGRATLFWVRCLRHKVFVLYSSTPGRFSGKARVNAREKWIFSL